MAEFDGLIEVDDGAVVVALVEMRRAAVGIRTRELGIDLERLLEIGDRRVVLALFQ